MCQNNMKYNKKHFLPLKSYNILILSSHLADAFIQHLPRQPWFICKLK